MAFKTGGRVHLGSRNDEDFCTRYPALAQALRAMPDQTMIDGEIVALNESGRPSFNALQNYFSTGISLVHYVFDLLVLRGEDRSEEHTSELQSLRHLVCR